MARFENPEDAVKALHRMIVYVRDEAARLRLADAALILGYAEDVVRSRPVPYAEDCGRDEWPGTPIVQH